MNEIANKFFTARGITGEGTMPRRSEWNVVDYCREEVERQGHDTRTMDGLDRVKYMLDAWTYAMRYVDAYGVLEKPTTEALIVIAKLIEPDKNRNGIRKVNVRIGSVKLPDHGDVQRLLAGFFLRLPKLNPFEAYRELLEVHPFEDGNGRTAKVILNWLNGTLLSPVFPPNDFWGRPIRNP